MSTVYKVHPCIGIARVGNSLDRFFVGPEVPGGAPREIGEGGRETDLQTYKHEGKIKRQGARFRIFEYDRDDATGALTLRREITREQATITWTVTLANLKNGGAPIRPGARSIPATDPGPVEIEGTLGGTAEPIKLGDLRTDSAGRLVVLGGHGKGRASGATSYDDTSDGLVQATLRLRGAPEDVAADPAWVICASPDYAPTLGLYVNLHDVAYQVAATAGWVTPPARPSFRDDILPILRRAAGLFWVHDDAPWGDPDLQRFAALGTLPGDRPTRDRVYKLLRDQDVLNDTALTNVQKGMLESWVDGDFVADGDAPPEPFAPVPGNLERAALELTAAAFGPGIEASREIRNRSIYVEREPFRIKPTTPPGTLTKGLQIFPWHRDYEACEHHWWPSQRPDRVLSGGRFETWRRGVESGEMLEKWSELGYALPAPGPELKLVERERNLP